MIVICQACGADNDDEARFCDQCGQPLANALLENSAAAVNAPRASAAAAPAVPVSSAPATAPAPAPANPAALPGPTAGTVNWLGLGVIAVVIAGLAFLLFSGQGAGKPGAAGGQDPSVGVMEQAQAQLKQYKDALAKDPLDLDALKGLYGMYSQIGQVEKVRPYLDAALKELQQRVDSGKLPAQAAPQSATEAGAAAPPHGTDTTAPPNDATKYALDLAMAAMSGDDPLGAITCLKAYYHYNPGRLDTAKMIADISYDIRMSDKTNDDALRLQMEQDAVEWYTKYLGLADPQAAAADIANAMVDRATMRMLLAEKGGSPADLDTALSELKQVMAAHPEHWAAHFNYGQALLQKGDKTAAEQTWNACKPLALNAEEKWRTDAALAALHGEPEPPRPPDMGSDVATGSAAPSQPMAGAAGANPHERPAFGAGVEGK